MSATARSDRNQADRDDPKSGAAGAQRLRDAIDRGGGGKVAFSDSAAAPLGTDDEAGGHPPNREQVARARAHEIRQSEVSGAKPTPADLQPCTGRRRRVPVAVILLLADFLIVVAVVV